MTTPADSPVDAPPTPSPATADPTAGGPTNCLEAPWLDTVRWSPDGLVAAIAQDATTQRVLTLAWMNREALARTLVTGEVHYWSRSRARLWHKGEQSGHVQRLRELRLDCDGDAIVMQVEPVGGIACHTGRESCFYRRLESAEGSGGVWREADPVLEDPEEVYGMAAEPGTTAPADAEVLARLARTIEQRRRAAPDSSYVASLFAKGHDAILKKIGEEATETVIAAKDGDKLRILAETADLWFHCLVMLAHHGLGPADVLAELAGREGRSGLDEKRSRNPG